MIDRDTVREVAKLARLFIDEAGVDAMARDLSKITTYIDQLASVDTRDVDLNDEAVVEGNPWQDDEVVPSARPQTLTSNAPAAEAGYVMVPKVLADAEGVEE